MSAPKRARSKKGQLEMLIDFILENPVMANLKINPSNSKESRVFEEKWNEVTTLLNSSGLGPEKEKSEWKTVYTDLKYKTKKRARALRTGIEETGSGPPQQKPLTALDEKVIGIVGRVTIEGDTNIPELGVASPVTNESDNNGNYEADNGMISTEIFPAQGSNAVHEASFLVDNGMIPTEKFSAQDSNAVHEAPLRTYRKRSKSAQYKSSLERTSEAFLSNFERQNEQWNKLTTAINENTKALYEVAAAMRGDALDP